MFPIQDEPRPLCHDHEPDLETSLERLVDRVIDCLI